MFKVDPGLYLLITKPGVEKLDLERLETELRNLLTNNI